MGSPTLGINKLAGNGFGLRPGWDIGPWMASASGPVRVPRSGSVSEGIMARHMRVCSAPGAEQ